MKKVLSVIILAVFASSTVMAMPAPVNQAKDGVKTIIMSPKHISDDAQAEYKASPDFRPFGLVGGALKGATYMVKDMVTGSWHVVTAPLAR